MSTVHTANPHLAAMDSDHMHHLGLSYSPAAAAEWRARFGDIKFVIMGGSNPRMTGLAGQMADALGLAAPFGYELACIAGTSRYVVYKVGPVLIASHGMGMPSISILLHEVAKLLEYAAATDVTFIRMGTSGGVGVEPGTVVITSEGVNQKMEAVHTVEVLDRTVRRPSPCTPSVVAGLEQAAKDLGMASAVGKTLSCDDFYEGQGRLDGALCEYTLEDKMAFLRYCDAHGVRNIEMEIRLLAAFCHRLNIKVGCVCVALLNRLNGDQVTSSHEELMDFENRAGKVAIQFVKNELAKSA